jgi:ABC-2 type transport system permease protein
MRGSPVSKFWKVAVYEYTRHVLRRRFLFGLLSVPFMIALMFGVIYLLIITQMNNKPIGYVDLSGLLAKPQSSPELSSPGPQVKIIPFTTEALARQALDSDQIQAYYVLDANYMQTGQARLIARKQPDSSVQNQFLAFLRTNLLSGQPQQVAQRILEGNNLVVRSSDGTRQVGENDWFNVLVPFIAGLAFMIAIFSTSGYLMQAVVEEKENRTMEVLITSVSSQQLMGGKIIGIIGVGLTQVLAWFGAGILVILLGRNAIPWMRGIHMSFDTAALLTISFIPSFVMIAALMAAVGATVTESREGQQITGLFTLPIAVPYWLAAVILNNPNGPLAVVLSFFPLTAPATLAMRIGLVQIPTWQFILNILILVLTALGALWLAGRTFRLGMLQYGQRLSLRQIFGRTTRGGASR